jgi:hypothetical protein
MQECKPLLNFNFQNIAVVSGVKLNIRILYLMRFKYRTSKGKKVLNGW